MLNIREIKNKEVWENFLFGIKEKTFLNSWNWGEFNKIMGETIWRWGIYEQRELVGVCLIIKISAKRGTFLFLPHGPAIKHQASSIKHQVLSILKERLKELAGEEGASFIRVAPLWSRTEENAKIFVDFGFRQAPIHIHPELTWQTDISLSEDELLAKMRKTTRYLVRQGLKDPEIRIKKTAAEEGVIMFNELYKKTARRHDFIPFSLKYLKTEFAVFSKDNQILTLVGEYQGEIVASAMVIFWQGTGYYHQGASVAVKAPVAYLLQWEAIKEAKSRGCGFYNFWGIADLPEEKIKQARNHPWWGLSLFKMGFGGERKEYIRTQDLVLSAKYWLNYLIESIRKRRRGF